MTKEEFVKYLLKCNRGAVFGCNVVSAVEKNLVNKALFKRFAVECADEIEKLTNKLPDAVIYMLDRISKKYPLASRKQTYLLQCSLNGYSIDKQKHFAYVTKSRVFFGKNAKIDTTKRSWGVYYNPLAGRYAENYTFKLRDVELKESVLGNPKGVLWITDFEKLMAHLKGVSEEDRTDRARDILGLAHYKAGEQLVIVKVPGDLVGDNDNARPVFPDAGAHDRFKAIADNTDNIGNKHWGYTVDLEKLSLLEKLSSNEDKEKVEIDGMPERVCKPIPVPENYVASVYYLSTLVKTNIGCANDTFKEVMLERPKRKLEDIEEELLTYVK